MKPHHKLFRMRVRGCLPPWLIPTAVVTLALGLSAPGEVQAQTTVIPPDADTSRLRPTPLPLPSVPKFDLRIESPEKSPVPKTVDEISFDVKDIVIEGADHYPAKQVQRFFEHLPGQRTTLSTIREAADKLEAQYRKDGFFLVRVFIPPQQVKDGLFRIRVIEGFIDNVYAEGGSDAARELIENMFAHLLNKKPIDLASLERALLILNDMPGVRGSGVLRQGAQLGASELIITLSDLPKRSYTVGINNTASKTMGEISSLVNINIANPFESHPGLLSLGANTSGNTEQLKALNARYAAAVGTQGLVMSMGGLVANAKPGASLRALDIESNSVSLGPRVRYPLIRSRGLSTYLDSGLTLNYSRTTLLGSELTRDRSSVLDVGFTVVDNDRWRGNTEFGINVSHGLEMLGAAGQGNPNPSVAGFTPNFTKLRFNLVRLQTLPAQLSLQLTGQGQFTTDKLLAGEQVFFGGMGIGRGYDTGAVVGDKGFGTLLELRRDFYPGQWPGISDGTVQLYVFADYAEARFTSTNAPSRWLHSVGTGMRYLNSSGLSLEMLVADARRAIQVTDSRGDPRVLVLVTKRF